MPMHVIHDEGESVRPKTNLKFSELMYHKKDANTGTSAYDMLFNALKKLDTLYNPAMLRMHEPVIEGNYKVTRDTRVIPLVEREEDEIQWVCSMSISTDAVEPETLKEDMTRPNVHLCKMSVICEVNNFLSRKSRIPTKRSVMKS